jgi:hypothetical protein
VEAGTPLKEWDERLSELEVSSCEGYRLLKRIYHRVAYMNPRHTDEYSQLNEELNVNTIQERRRAAV